MAGKNNISMTGFRADSPDRFNRMNVIPTGRISMDNVPHPVYGMDEYGNAILMQPGGEYQFPGNTVYEFPMLQRGGQPRHVSYDRLMRDWQEQAAGNTPFGDRGQLYYQGFDNAIGNYSPLHPNVRKMVDLDYLEDYVTQAHKSSGIYGGSGDNAYKKKAMMGQIPVRFDEAGKAQILTDARGGFGRRGKGIKGVEYFPVNWEQYMYDQTSDPTNEVYGQSSVHNQQFLPPVKVTSDKKVPKWVPKGGLTREQSQGITNLINAYNSDQGIHDAVDTKKFSSNGKLTREQAFKLMQKDPSLYKKSIDKHFAGYDKVRGLTEAEAEASKNYSYGLNTGIALIDDLGTPIVESAKSLWNDPGQIGYIPDAYKAYGQTMMPEIFGEVPLPGQAGYDPEYWDNAIKGVTATENLLNTVPTYGGYNLMKLKALKAGMPYVKKVAGKVMPQYKNVYRVEPSAYVDDITDPLSGRWYSDNPGDIAFYADKYKNQPMNITRKKIPAKQWEQMSGANMPQTAREMSVGPGQYANYTVAEQAGLLPPGAGMRLNMAKRYGTNKVLLESDKLGLTSPQLYRTSEGIVPIRMANQLRTGTPSLGRFSNFERVNMPNQAAAMDYMLGSQEYLNKPFLGINRSYLPFQAGGPTPIPNELESNTLDVHGNLIGTDEEGYVEDPLGALEATLSDPSAKSIRERDNQLITWAQEKDQSQYDQPGLGQSYYVDANTHKILDPYDYGFATSNIRVPIQPISQANLRETYLKNNPRYSFQDGGVAPVMTPVDLPPAPVESPAETPAPVIDPSNYDYHLMRNIRSKYAFLDPETERWTTPGEYDFGGKKKLKAGDLTPHRAPITTTDYETFRVGNTQWKPEVEDYEDTGVTFDDGSSIRLVYRDNPKYGRIPMYLPSGDDAAKYLKKWTKSYGNFQQTQQRNPWTIPMYQVPEDEAQGYYDYLQGLNTMKSGGNWIQKATASIDRRGTAGVCTGDNFGGPSCRPGTKRYNLAKTFKAMAKKQYGGNGNGPQNMDIDGVRGAKTGLLKNHLAQNMYSAMVDQEAEQLSNAMAGMHMMPDGSMMPNSMMQMGGASSQWNYNPSQANIDPYMSAYEDLTGQARNQWSDFWDKSMNFMGEIPGSQDLVWKQKTKFTDPAARKQYRQDKKQYKQSQQMDQWDAMNQKIMKAKDEGQQISMGEIFGSNPFMQFGGQPPQGSYYDNFGRLQFGDPRFNPSMQNMTMGIGPNGYTGYPPVVTGQIQPQGRPADYWDQPQPGTFGMQTRGDRMRQIGNSYGFPMKDYGAQFDQWKQSQGIPSWVKTPEQMSAWRSFNPIQFGTPKMAQFGEDEYTIKDGAVWKTNPDGSSTQMANVPKGVTDLSNYDPATNSFRIYDKILKKPKGKSKTINTTQQEAVSDLTAGKKKDTPATTRTGNYTDPAGGGTGDGQQQIDPRTGQPIFITDPTGGNYGGFALPRRMRGARGPMIAYNPAQTYLDEYKYKGRLFGPGARKVKMKFSHGVPTQGAPNPADGDAFPAESDRSLADIQRETRDFERQADESRGRAAEYRSSADATRKRTERIKDKTQAIRDKTAQTRADAAAIREHTADRISELEDRYAAEKHVRDYEKRQRDLERLKREGKLDEDYYNFGGGVPPNPFQDINAFPIAPPIMQMGGDPNDWYNRMQYMNDAVGYHFGDVNTPNTEPNMADYAETTVTGKRRGMSGNAWADLGAGIASGIGAWDKMKQANSMKQLMRKRQLSDGVFAATGAGDAFRGTHQVNTGENFPHQRTPVFDPGYNFGMIDSPIVQGQFGGQFGNIAQGAQRTARFADLYGQAQDEMDDITSWTGTPNPDNPAEVRQYMMENPRLGWEVAGAPMDMGNGQVGYMEDVVQPVPQGYADWAEYAKQNPLPAQQQGGSTLRPGQWSALEHKGPAGYRHGLQDAFDLPHTKEAHTMRLGLAAGLRDMRNDSQIMWTRNPDGSLTQMSQPSVGVPTDPFTTSPNQPQYGCGGKTKMHYQEGGSTPVLNQETGLMEYVDPETGYTMQYKQPSYWNQDYTVQRPANFEGGPGGRGFFEGAPQPPNARWFENGAGQGEMIPFEDPYGINIRKQLGGRTKTLYQEGGEYYLDDNEIQAILAQGGQVEYL